jgi:hypothetical protein
LFKMVWPKELSGLLNKHQKCFKFWFRIFTVIYLFVDFVNSQYVYGFFSHIYSTPLILLRIFSGHVQFHSMYSAGMHGKNLLEDLPQCTFSAKTNRFFSHILSVPDMRSRDHEVVVVRRTIILGAGNFGMGREWGGVEKGEVSSRVTWDQGRRDPIRARRVSK